MKQLIDNICSENDFIYGANHLNNEMIHLRDLITSSNTFNILDKGDVGGACLIRYQKMFKTKESRPWVLKNYSYHL